jgi:hypothetical protein
VRRRGARRLIGTLVAVAVAFATGLGVAEVLRRRDAARVDRRALTALEQELGVFPAPPGATSEPPQRSDLCCTAGKCAPHLSRRDAVGTATELPAFYRRAFEREGWQRREIAEPATGYFTKEVAGRDVTGSYHLAGDGKSASLAFNLDAEGC